MNNRGNKPEPSSSGSTVTDIEFMNQDGEFVTSYVEQKWWNSTSLKLGKQNQQMTSLGYCRHCGEFCFGEGSIPCDDFQTQQELN